MCRLFEREQAHHFSVSAPGMPVSLTWGANGSAERRDGSLLV